MLASIHLALVTTSCWRECVHIVHIPPQCCFNVCQRRTQWPVVVSGPTLAQHWVNVSCLLGQHNRNRWTDEHLRGEALPYLEVLGMCCWTGFLFELPALAQGVFLSFRNWDRVLFWASNSGHPLSMYFVDLQATIDHDLLLSRLTEWFGIDGVVLQWVRSYLTGRSQLGKVNGVLSTPQLLLCLDYCNSLLFGCSEKYKTSLQRVQNCLARVVTRSSRLSESRPLLKSLHWLPIKSRIKFKLNLLTCKALFMGTLSYLSDLLHFEKHQQTLRSESTKLLHPGQRSKKNYGHSSFVVAAPRLWNTWIKISHYLSEKIKNTPFYIRPTTLIWASTDRHMMNSFSDYGPPHWILILVHSAIESQYCWEILAL